MNVAKTFREKNPGGNVTTGIAVSSDYYQPNGGAWQVNALFNYFGAYPKQWIKDEAGNVVYGSVTDACRDALAAVSYTHLDVYKRQGSCVSGARGAGTRWRRTA